MKHQVRLKIKEIHKDLVQEIRKRKFDCHHAYSWEFRHRHIAYCLLRGRTMEQIERKTREDNHPSERLIDKYKEEYTKMLSDYMEASDEAVRSCR